MTIIRKHTVKEKFRYFRFEFLLFALLLTLFDRAFFTDLLFFNQYVWPANMFILSVASYFIFKERSNWANFFKALTSLCTIFIPIFFNWITKSAFLTNLAFSIYLSYYLLILVEILRQIFMRSESNLSVIFGSISGYLLMIFVANFAFILIEYNSPGSFSQISNHNISTIYDQLSYFSMTSIATVGYGDILPISPAARLTTMFFTISGQFYMVALVGIIISRFTRR